MHLKKKITVIVSKISKFQPQFNSDIDMDI
jgi:hypothetical protein